MRRALLIAALGIASCKTVPDVSPCAQGATPQDFPLPANVTQTLTGSQQGVCQDAPNPSPFAWWQYCDNRYRSVMAVHCVGAVQTWCQQHCQSDDCGGSLSATKVGTACAQGIYQSFASALPYCAGFFLKDEDRVLVQRDGGQPTCP